MSITTTNSVIKYTNSVDVNLDNEFPHGQLSVLESSLNNENIFVFDISINCFLIHLLCLFGIVGNVLNLLVLSYNGLNDSINLILFSLSITDLFGSVFRQARRLKCLVAQFDVPASTSVETFGNVCLIVLSNGCLGLSIAQTTVIAVERLVAVCFPFQASRIFTPTRVKHLLIILYSVAVLVLSPFIYRLGYSWEVDPMTNATVAITVITQYYKDSSDTLNLFSLVINSYLCTTGTLLTILVCCVVIIVKLMITSNVRAMDTIHSSKSRQVREAKVIKMLLTVCIFTLVSCLPTAVMDLYLIYFQNHFFNGVLFYLVLSLDDVLYQVSASVNFIIYVTMSSKFNTIYKKLFWPDFSSKFLSS